MQPVIARNISAQNACEIIGFLFSLSIGQEKVKFNLPLPLEWLGKIRFYFLSKNSCENKMFLIYISNNVQLIGATWCIYGNKNGRM